MSVIIGLTLGLGLFLVWQACWVQPPRRATKETSRLQELINQSGLTKIKPAGVVVVSILAAVVSFLLVAALTRTVPIGACFGIFAAGTPVLILRWQARKRSTQLREVWPDAIDHLRSGVRAGLTLPEALIQLGTRGPVQLRPPLQEFAQDYRSGMRFLDALENLKNSMADPVADRLVAALRVTREVGGADIGKMLEALSEFLRDDARTRAELETRQSWTINGARLAVIAPWVVLILLTLQPETARAYQTVSGALILFGGVVACVICYQIMMRIGRLPAERRVL